MVGCLPENIHVANVETRLDIFVDDCLQQTLHIPPFIAYHLHFRKSAIYDVLREGSLPFGFSLGGESSGIHMVVDTVFAEREGKQANLIVASSEMRGKFSAQQFGIAARHHDVQIASEEAVDKQMPALHVLYLIKKDVLDIGVVYLIDAGKDGIQVLSLQVGKAIVVEVGVSISHAVL